MATYITPKTDWQPTDYFTPTDYNRIKNNLVYVNDIYNELYGHYEFNPGADIGSQAFYKASKFNMFEECVEKLQRSGVIYTFGERSYYEDNGRMPDYNQLNRLEKCIAAYANVDVDVSGVTVSPSVAGFKNKASALPKSNVQKLTATVSPQQAFNKNVSWTSNDTSVATVDNNGNVSLTTKGGVAYITATTEDGGFTDTATIYSVIKADSLTIRGDIELEVGNTLNIAPQVSYAPADANYLTIEYSSSNDNIFTVNSQGVITAAAVGNATLTITLTQAYPDDPNPYVITATKQVLVREVYVPVESITIEPSSIIMGKNSSATLTATVTPANATEQSITWISSSSGTVAIKKQNGLTCTINSKTSIGTVTITARSSDGTHSATCKVTVKLVSNGTMLNGKVIGFAVVQYNHSNIMAVMPYYFIPVDLDDFTKTISYGNGGAYKGTYPCSNLFQAVTKFKENVLSEPFQSKLSGCKKYCIKEVSSGSKSFNYEGFSCIVPSLTELGGSLPKFDKIDTFDTGYKGVPACGAYYCNGRNPITDEFIYDFELITRSSKMSRVYAARPNGSHIESIEYRPSDKVIQFYKPLIYINPNIKVFNVEYENMGYVIDWNNTDDSIYVKDIEEIAGDYATTVYICDPPDEIRQQLGVL